MPAISLNLATFWDASCNKLVNEQLFYPATFWRLACECAWCGDRRRFFAMDAWNNITFTAGEVINPRRNIPLSLALGTIVVISLYLLANVTYLLVLPLQGDPNATNLFLQAGYAICL